MASLVDAQRDFIDADIDPEEAEPQRTKSNLRLPKLAIREPRPHKLRNRRDDVGTQQNAESRSDRIDERCREAAPREAALRADLDRAET